MRCVTVEQYAQSVASSAKTIREMCKKGKLPAIKIGKGWRIDADAADEYLRQRMSERMIHQSSPLQKQNNPNNPKAKGASDWRKRLEEIAG